jgi:hypothetical protein
MVPVSLDRTQARTFIDLTMTPHHHVKLLVGLLPRVTPFGLPHSAAFKGNILAPRFFCHRLRRRGQADPSPSGVFCMTSKQSMRDRQRGALLSLAVGDPAGNLYLAPGPTGR